ncbi:hypothetical protein G6F57_008843 [Rhizopus arrhizus]|uniref:Uncharacterized protein n=1 Tax=Rhizopus oryzae TaxID=64495 RepID=A0A9P6X4Q9_RHIOR|nr:hypothetical protein G6F23_003952 [Rhizopus arrhizus]KAG1418121.1 hypothetical protein G6F58_005205 [Rhizopus delemar]KAG0763749.1 hypothetical protein G6F24_005777 [Rhizopus arrhizus]KAG0786215.1 hypothetical protein G6F21_008746 [Rhizopus arrhizus]KAG0808743.1 hypothetical protein G6F20_009332 [Rhizopus arrhizus]
MPKKVVHKQRSMIQEYPPNVYSNGIMRPWQEKQMALDKVTHPEWGILKEEEFLPLTHKHQNDLEDLHRNGQSISDFYFWQANLGGYCMADMVQIEVLVSSEGAFPLVRRIVDGAPHPGRKKKKRTD